MSASPAPAALPLPAPRPLPKKPSQPEQLKLPGASVELVVIAVVIAGVRVEVREGCLGHSARMQARTALLLGGQVVFGGAVEVQS